MKKVYTSACVVIPPEDKWESIQQIRTKYDRQFHRWIPHINLIYPFYSKDLFYDLESKFREICRRINSFKIKFNKIQYFQHKHQNYTLWLNPEPKELIVHLQSKLLKIVPDCNDLNKYKGGFTPHLSVGQIKGKKDLFEMINEIQNSWKELEFKVSSIYFISRENNKFSKFEVVKEILLKSQN
ncbi:MAG: 2'-5' RNA ligase family protein [Candidatus Hermodarchaeota archaeon]